MCLLAILLSIDMHESLFDLEFILRTNCVDCSLIFGEILKREFARDICKRASSNLIHMSIVDSVNSMTRNLCELYIIIINIIIIIINIIYIF